MHRRELLDFLPGVGGLQRGEPDIDHVVRTRFERRQYAVGISKLKRCQ
jgi:hypothetical protein